MRKAILILVITFSLHMSMAEEAPAEVSLEEYEASIASFGISKEDSETASREAARIVGEIKKQEKENPMESLPDNWLEDTRY